MIPYYASIEELTRFVMESRPAVTGFFRVTPERQGLLLQAQLRPGFAADSELEGRLSTALSASLPAGLTHAIWLFPHDAFPQRMTHERKLAYLQR